MRRLKRSLAFLLTAVLLAALVPSAALAWTGPDVTAPEAHELVCFVDCGASTFPEEIQTLMAEYPDSVKNTTPDQAYTTLVISQFSHTPRRGPPPPPGSTWGGGGEIGAAL